MKVVLFCGGQGLRARESLGEGATHLPKPLQLVGGRPLLWHVMSWYARFGHRDFVLCTGFGAHLIRSWFEQHAVRLVVEQDLPGERVLELVGGDMDGWRVTLAETGLEASVGMRLRAVRHLLEREPLFLANYSDVFCDISLPELVAEAWSSGATATFAAVRPNHSFHVVDLAPGGQVQAVTPAVESDQWINGGYFVMRPSVFDVLAPGEDLVEEPFARLIRRGELRGHRHRGFWAPMDTAKDRLRLEALWTSGERPWTRDPGNDLVPSPRSATGPLC